VQCFAFGSDLFQLAGVEPETAATWAFVHHHAALFAIVMAHQDNIATFWTMAALLEVDLNGSISRNADFNVPGDFLSRLDLLQFESIEPNAATPAVADIKDDTSGHELSQITATSWTDHMPATLRPK